MDRQLASLILAWFVIFEYVVIIIYLIGLMN